MGRQLLGLMLVGMLVGVVERRLLRQSFHVACLFPRPVPGQSLLVRRTEGWSASIRRLDKVGLHIQTGAVISADPWWW